MFFEPELHANAVYELDPIHRYRCDQGRWTCERFHGSRSKSPKLGSLMRGVDRCLREALGFEHPLKVTGKTPKYVQKFIDEEISAWLSWQAAHAPRHIEIDVGQLAGIRATAAVTCDALLIEEERTGEGSRCWRRHARMMPLRRAGRMTPLKKTGRVAPSRGAKSQGWETPCSSSAQTAPPSLTTTVTTWKECSAMRNAPSPSLDPQAAPRVPKRVAAVILNSLKGGVVPRIGLPYITVGREVEIRALLTDLSLIADGGASFRFLVGRYGAGKSFLLQTIRTHAMGEGFVVADADLSPERRLQGGQGQGLATYRELIRNISTKTRPRGRCTQPDSRPVGRQHRSGRRFRRNPIAHSAFRT